MSDEFTALGKFAWDVVTSNRPKVNVSADYIAAIPKGAEWNELSAPVGESFFRWDWHGPGLILKDFIYEMEVRWKYGATYKGGGAYITNAVVTVLDYDVGIGGYEINISCRIGNIEPAFNSKPNAPVPNIPIDVTLAWTNWFSAGGGTNRFEIRGTGGGSEKYDDESYEP